MQQSGSNMMLRRWRSSAVQCSSARFLLPTAASSTCQTRASRACSRQSRAELIHTGSTSPYMPRLPPHRRMLHDHLKSEVM